MKNRLIWLGLLVVMTLPVAMATRSPYLPFRSSIYVLAGFAGIICLSIFVLQPLLSTNHLPLHPIQTRRLHRIVGTSVLILAIMHVAGLYLTSPPDVIDALLLRAPTLFSVFGVVAMWGIILTVLIAKLRRTLPANIWRATHRTLSTLVIFATLIHALQIQGMMEPITKWIISIAVLLSIGFTLIWLKPRA